MRAHAASFHLVRLFAATFLAGLVSGWGQSLSVRIGDQLDFQVPASLLLPLAATCVMNGVVIDPVGPIAATTTRPLRLLAAGRLTSAFLLFTLGLVLGLTLVDGSVGEFAVVLRNAALLLGIGLASVCVLDLALAWIPACSSVISCMVAGARPDGTRAPWAVLLEREPQDPTPWIVSAAVLSVGVASIITRLRKRQSR